MLGCLLRNVSAALNPAGPLPMAMKPAATTLLWVPLPRVADALRQRFVTFAEQRPGRTRSGVGPSAHGAARRPRGAHQGARATARRHRAGDRAGDDAVHRAQRRLPAPAAAPAGAG